MIMGAAGTRPGPAHSDGRPSTPPRQPLIARAPAVRTMAHIQDADARELDAHLDQSSEVLVLFHGASDPYSRAFYDDTFKDAKLPTGVDAIRAIIQDDDDASWDRWTLDITPTVAYFKGGTEMHRIEGLDNRGLEAHEFRRYVDKVATAHRHAGSARVA